MSGILVEDASVPLVFVFVLFFVLLMILQVEDSPEAQPLLGYRLGLELLPPGLCISILNGLESGLLLHLVDSSLAGGCRNLRDHLHGMQGSRRKGAVEFVC